MRTLDTNVTIAVPRDAVWSVLTDLASYPRWNPFIRQVRGPCQVGSYVGIKMHIPGKGLQDYRVKITQLNAQREFRWLGQFHVRGLIDGDHGFVLDANMGDFSTTVRQTESFGGVLIPFVWNSFILKHLLAGFHELNANLKAHCEGQPLPHVLADIDGD